MAARAYGIRIGDVRRLSPRTSDDHGRYHHLVACQISQESTTEVAVAHIGPQRPVQRTALPHQIEDAEFHRPLLRFAWLA